ncbi:interleukin-5 receptor subunit alpha-like [Pelodytes ibericus]
MVELGLNSVNLSWSITIPENMTSKDLEISYFVSYQYLDRQYPKEISLTENQTTIKLGLHPGFIANISAAFYHGDLILTSNWTPFTYEAPAAYIYNTSCYIYNVTSLNCTWDIKKEAPEDAQYSFSLREGAHWLPCKYYLTNQENRNMGCHLKHVFANVTKNKMRLRIVIKLSRHGMDFFKNFRIANIQILNPPLNISLLYENRKRKIQWIQPPTLEDLSSFCFGYQIQLFEVKKNELFRFFNTSDTEYILSDLDQNKKYSVQIRGQNEHCAKSKFWGQWSEPVFIGKDNEGIETWVIFSIIIVCTTSTGVPLLYIFKRFSYNRKLFDTAVPVPSQKIKDWIFSTEINFQKCVSNIYSESVPITNIEIVTTVTVNPQGKQDNELSRIKEALDLSRRREIKRTGKRKNHYGAPGSSRNSKLKIPKA